MNSNSVLLWSAWSLSTDHHTKGTNVVSCVAGDKTNHICSFSLLTCLLTYSIKQSPSWEANRSQLAKKFPAFYGTRRFITAFTSARHLSLSWATSIQSIPPHPTLQEYPILILSSHLHLRLPSGSFPPVSPWEPCLRLSSPPYVLHAPPISFFSNLCNFFFFFFFFSSSSYNITLKMASITAELCCRKIVNKIHLKHCSAFCWLFMYYESD